MERDERQQLRTITDEIVGWVDQARSVLTHRAKVDKAADDAIGALRRAVVDARRGGTVEWRTLPLAAGDSRLLGDVARKAHQPSLSGVESRALDRLTTEVAKALHDVKAVVGARRFFSGSKKRDAGEASAEFRTQFRDWGASSRVPQLLQRIDKQDDKPAEVNVADALADWVGLRARVTDLGSSPEVVASAVVAELPAAIKTIDKALKDEARFRSDALAAGDAVRKRELRRLVSEMPVDRLKDATRDRLRIGPLTDAGITTVQAVLDRGANLEHLPGIGATTGGAVGAQVHLKRLGQLHHPGGDWDIAASPPGGEAGPVVAFEGTGQGLADLPIQTDTLGHQARGEAVGVDQRCQPRPRSHQQRQPFDVELLVLLQRSGPPGVGAR